MVWTKHGHQIVGTIAEDPKDKPKTARCGGPGHCDECDNDVALAQLKEKLHGGVPVDPRQESLERRARIAAYNVLFLEIQRHANENSRHRTGIHPETVKVTDMMINILGRAAEDILRDGQIDTTFLHDFLTNFENRKRLQPKIDQIMEWLQRGWHLKMNRGSEKALDIPWIDLRYIQDVFNAETDFTTHSGVWLNGEEYFLLAHKALTKEDFNTSAFKDMADLVDKS